MNFDTFKPFLNTKNAIQFESREYRTRFHWERNKYTHTKYQHDRFMAI